MLVTERLILRDTRMSDAPALFGILGDREAMQYTQSCASLRACRRHVAGHEWQRRRTGHAPWTIARKTDGAIIGRGGLYEDPFDRGWGLEIGYWFARPAWGQGFASELVNASLDFARGRGRYAGQRLYAARERCIMSRTQEGGLSQGALCREHGAQSLPARAFVISPRAPFLSRRGSDSYVATILDASPEKLSFVLPRAIGAPGGRIADLTRRELLRPEDFALPRHVR
jgi:ribosomal-protein-alanine N-acetyltransferase